MHVSNGTYQLSAHPMWDTFLVKHRTSVPPHNFLAHLPTLPQPALGFRIILSIISVKNTQAAQFLLHRYFKAETHVYVPIYR